MRIKAAISANVRQRTMPFVAINLWQGVVFVDVRQDTPVPAPLAVLLLLNSTVKIMSKQRDRRRQQPFIVAVCELHFRTLANAASDPLQKTAEIPIICVHPLILALSLWHLLQ